MLHCVSAADEHVAEVMLSAGIAKASEVPGSGPCRDMEGVELDFGKLVMLTAAIADLNGTCSHSHVVQPHRVAPA